MMIWRWHKKRFLEWGLLESIRWDSARLECGFCSEGYGHTVMFRVDYGVVDFQCPVTDEVAHATTVALGGVTCRSTFQKYLGLSDAIFTKEDC